MNPLAGKCILVTRAAAQAREVGELLAARGAVATYLPCLEVQCLPDAIREGFARAPDGCTLIFTSSNGVTCAAAALGAHFTPRLAAHPVVAVGEQTAAALRTQGIEPAWVARDASQEGLIDGFAIHGLPAEVLFLRAEEGRDALQQALAAQGTAVRLVHAYRTVCPDDDAPEIMQALRDGRVDAVLLGSSRTVLHYMRRIGDPELADRPAVCVISPQVAAAAKGAGLHVQAVAKQASFADMLDALADYFAENRRPEETHP